MWSFETEIDFNIIFYGDELILTLLCKGYLTNAFYMEGYENALQLTPKPIAKGTPNLAYGLVFTKTF